MRGPTGPTRYRGVGAKFIATSCIIARSLPSRTTKVGAHHTPSFLSRKDATPRLLGVASRATLGASGCPITDVGPARLAGPLRIASRGEMKKLQLAYISSSDRIAVSLNLVTWPTKILPGISLLRRAT